MSLKVALLLAGWLKKCFGVNVEWVLNWDIWSCRNCSSQMTHVLILICFRNHHILFFIDALSACLKYRQGRCEMLIVYRWINVLWSVHTNRSIYWLVRNLRHWRTRKVPIEGMLRCSFECFIKCEWKLCIVLIIWRWIYCLCRIKFTFSATRK